MIAIHNRATFIGRQMGRDSRTGPPQINDGASRCVAEIFLTRSLAVMIVLVVAAAAALCNKMSDRNNSETMRDRSLMSTEDQHEYDEVHDDLSNGPNTNPYSHSINPKICLQSSMRKKIIVIITLTLPDRRLLSTEEQ